MSMRRFRCIEPFSCNCLGLHRFVQQALCSHLLAFCVLQLRECMLQLLCSFHAGVCGACQLFVADHHFLLRLREPVVHSTLEFCRSFRCSFNLSELQFHFTNLRAAILIDHVLRILLILRKLRIQHREVAQPDSQAGLDPAFMRSVGLCMRVHGAISQTMFLHKHLSGLTNSWISPIEQALDFLCCEVALLLLCFQGCLCEPHLEDLQPKHLVLDQTVHDESIRANFPLLPNAVRSFHCLHVSSRIPCGINDDHPVCTRQIQPVSAHTCCQQHHLHSILFHLKLLNSLRPRGNIHRSIQSQKAYLMLAQDAYLDEIHHLETL
mmetsp:Transcript_54381/g.126906  ORF Transcript_54381/g.126906 Transcript_54381/m.126906 type:complete len:322 (+) Transcript_54381:1254-2219(+)